MTIGTTQSSLPGVGALLRLALPRGTEASSRVESCEGGEVLVAAPSSYVPAGTCTVSWGSPRGRWVQQVRVAREDGRVPMWRLTPVEPAVLEQRRRYARANVTLPVVLLGTDASWSGSLVDLSEGGARCAVRRPFGLDEGDELMIVLAGERLDLRLPGLVTRVEQQDEWLDAVVLSFEQRLEGTQAAAIRREVLHWQLRERATRADG